MRIIPHLVALAVVLGLAILSGFMIIAGARGQSAPAVPGGHGLYYGLNADADEQNGWWEHKQDFPMQTFTVATLPTCNSALYGYWYLISDATTPTYNGTPVGSGAVIVPVLCNGVVWKTH